MKRGFPQLLCRLARRLLPAARRPWADAMAAELYQIDDDRAALAFAGGCLLAAVRERIADVDTRFGAGLWSIAIVSALCAVFQLACAARGIAVLLGAPDGMRASLALQGAAPELLARYDVARPLVVACFLALGLVQLATAWFLSRGELRRFAIAWALALAVAGFAVLVQLSIVWQLDGVPSEFHALLVEAAAVPLLLGWYRRRQAMMPKVTP